MSLSFLQLREDQQRLMAQCDNLREEIRSETLKAIAIMDRLADILDEHQRRREEERKRLPL